MNGEYGSNNKRQDGQHTLTSDNKKNSEDIRPNSHRLQNG